MSIKMRSAYLGPKKTVRSEYLGPKKHAPRVGAGGPLWGFRAVRRVLLSIGHNSPRQYGK